MTAEESFRELCESIKQQVEEARTNANNPEQALDNLMMASYDIKDAVQKARYLIKRGAKV